MPTLKITVDAQTASLLERVVRQTGRTKSAVVRDALEALRNQRAVSTRTRPSEAMAHLIGSCDSGGLRLSEHTGERFARLLQEKKDRPGRRPAGRPRAGG